MKKEYTTPVVNMVELKVQSLMAASLRQNVTIDSSKETDVVFTEKHHPWESTNWE